MQTVLWSQTYQLDSQEDTFRDLWEVIKDWLRHTGCKWFICLPMNYWYVGFNQSYRCCRQEELFILLWLHLNENIVHRKLGARLLITELITPNKRQQTIKKWLLQIELLNLWLGLEQCPLDSFTKDTYWSIRAAEHQIFSWIPPKACCKKKQNMIDSMPQVKVSWVEIKSFIACK